MNSGVVSGSRRPAAVARRALQRQMEAWRELLAQCERRPGRKCVHALRVATLRAQAGVEFCLAGRALGDADARAVRRWRKQASKLRRRLAPARQADVFLTMLGQRRQEAAGGKDGAEGSQGYVDAIAELERAIGRGRQRAAKKVAAEIGERRKRLELLSRRVEDAFAGAAPVAGDGHLGGIAARMAALAGEFGELNEETLHGFRKRIKKIRYVAEIEGRTDPEAARAAAVLQRMAAAVGEWHDWQGLAAEAARHFGQGQGEGLVRFLEGESERSLERALELCGRALAQLRRSVKGGDPLERDAGNGSSRRVPRKPAGSVQPEAQRDDSEELTEAS